MFRAVIRDHKPQYLLQLTMNDRAKGEFELNASTECLQQRVRCAGETMANDPITEVVTSLVQV